MYDLTVIGAGPAGLAAAFYASRHRINSLLISKDIGGQANWTMHIENYLGYQLISGLDLIPKLESQTNNSFLERRIGDSVTRIDNSGGIFEINFDNEESIQAKVVIIATGKSPRMLGVSGETKYIGRGLSYCVVCDGPLFSDQRVAVIGGGNSAFEGALDLVKIASFVYIISLSQLTADPVLIEKLSGAKNLEILVNHATEQVDGDDFLKYIIVRDSLSGNVKKLAVSGVFVEIGLKANAELVKDMVKLNQSGEIPINCTCETIMPGLFAAGDVTDAPEKQIVVAASEGTKAAIQAERFLISM